MKIIYEYIWLDNECNFRSKTKITTKLYNNIKDVPIWNYDGSSTNQASGDNSEVLLKPIRIYKDPFRLINKCLSYLVLCETMTSDGSPHPDNKRYDACKLFETKIIRDSETMFGIEQEFFFYDIRNNLPLGMKKEKNHISGYSGPQGPYYCGVGAGKIFGRDLAEKALDNMLYCKLNITGLNLTSLQTTQVNFTNSIILAGGNMMGEAYIDNINGIYLETMVFLGFYFDTKYHQYQI